VKRFNSNLQRSVSINSSSSLINSISKYKYYYLMFLPGLLVLLIFAYAPMFGLIIAFKDYSFAEGIFKSPWASPDIFKWFKIAFTGDSFSTILKNTLLISFLKIIFNFPAPILLALLINEVRNKYFKKTVQTIIYLPHFISWVVISGIVMALLSSSNGILSAFGFKSSILMSPKYFRGLLVVSEMWKEAGWGTVVYLAAIAGISVEMYEAAVIDGCNRLQQIFYITLPSIVSTIAILLILRTGQIMSAGFDQIFVLYSPITYSVADIIDTYVYRTGLAVGRFSLATAVGLFKSLVGLILVLTTNKIVKGMGESGLW
jgi:putative aldouronate transport system permease protein